MVPESSLLDIRWNLSVPSTHQGTFPSAVSTTSPHPSQGVLDLAHGQVWGKDSLGFTTQRWKGVFPTDTDSCSRPSPQLLPPSQLVPASLPDPCLPHCRARLPQPSAMPVWPLLLSSLLSPDPHWPPLLLGSWLSSGAAAPGWFIISFYWVLCLH